MVPGCLPCSLCPLADGAWLPPSLCPLMHGAWLPSSLCPLMVPGCLPVCAPWWCLAASQFVPPDGAWLPPMLCPLMVPGCLPVCAPWWCHKLGSSQAQSGGHKLHSQVGVWFGAGQCLCFNLLPRQQKVRITGFAKATKTISTLWKIADFLPMKLDGDIHFLSGF